MSLQTTQLKDGLQLRWASPEDAEAIAQFNARVHANDPEKPEEPLTYWTRDLMSGQHPTTSAADFTVVTDPHADNQIVSTLNLISQTWAYEGIPFPVGRPELVGTDANYRRRGLVRKQMEWIHQRSAAKGELVQAITGIPWYYRQYGYEMALDLSGSRTLFWHQLRPAPSDEESPYQMRPATSADIPALEPLYQVCVGHGPVHRVRDRALWQYELFETDDKSPYNRQVAVIETAVSPKPVAYLEYHQWGSGFFVREVGVAAGHSWRAIGLFMVHTLKKQAESLNPSREKPIDNVCFSLGANHPLYQALDPELGPQRPPYGWYIRVPNLLAFLQHIAPALEQRLADSVMAGHSGTIRLNLFHSYLQLNWSAGQLEKVDQYQPKKVADGDAVFPDLTFLQLLFGRRSLAELNEAYPDCYTHSNESRVLLNILFPKRHSLVIPLG